MTRRFVYGVGLLAYLAATAMTIASIVIPRWISWDKETRSGHHVHYTYGLHSRCSSLQDRCERFPKHADCHGKDGSFCSLWRSVGFFMSFAVCIELATILAFVVIISGDRQKRQTGWSILSGMLVLAALVQAAGTSIIAYLYHHDDRFFPGWRLDTSFLLCTVSWALQLLAATGIVTAAFTLPWEGGYLLIPEDRGIGD